MSDYDDIETDVPREPNESACLCAMISVDGVVSMIPLPDGGEVTIGRDSSCDLVVQHPSVSRHHAKLRMSPLEITDVGGRNGTRVRGVVLQSGVPTPLAVGDGIQLGNVAILIHSTVVLDGALKAEGAPESSVRRLEM